MGRCSSRGAVNRSILVSILEQYSISGGGFIGRFLTRWGFLKKNLNAPRPSEHPPVFTVSLFLTHVKLMDYGYIGSIEIIC